MQHVGNGSDDAERARKRRKVDEAGPGVAPVHMITTWSGNNASTDGQVTNNLDYTCQYSNTLFPWIESGIDPRQTPKVYQGETTVGDNAILVQGDITHNHYHSQDSRQDKFDILLESLTFDRMDARLRNVAMPLMNTCQWLFKHELFCRWIEKDQVQEHHGFLWIKGKPGSGKSTIMKEVVAWAQRTWTTQIVLTYFFNARSPHYLENSTLGLYRPLLHQLLSAHREGHTMFVNRFASKIRAGKKVEEWTNVELQNFLIELIATTKIPSVNIFIDALDEGNTDDIRQMITFFERLTRCSVSASTFTRVCLSSRHYPYISLRKGFSLVLEDQASHMIDIDNYIRSELVSHDSLRIGNLREEVRDRSAGVFLWVVLVIPLLNRDFDCGKSVAAMRQELSRIPQDLRDIFVATISRDAEGMAECMALLRWVLFSQRPLSVAEAYDAVKQACSTTDIRDAADLHDSTLTKYILHCSRGLIEVIENKPDSRNWIPEPKTRKSVQFIHETVREFLLNEVGFKGTSAAAGKQPDISLDFCKDTCHMAMAEECMQYVLHLSQTTPVTKDPLEQYPLADYAAQHWHDHLSACGTQATQRMFDLASSILTGKHDHEVCPEIHNVMDIDGILDDAAAPLYRAVHIGVPQLVATLLSHSALVNASDGFDVNLKDGAGETALFTATDLGYQEIVQMLLKYGALVDVQNDHGETALYRAVSKGNEKMVRLLLSYGADANTQCNKNRTPLFLATHDGHEEIVELLLDSNADPDQKSENSGVSGFYWSSLEVAVGKGYGRIVQSLCEHGANVHVPSMYWICDSQEGARTCLAEALIRNLNAKRECNRDQERKYEMVVDILRLHGAPEKFSSEEEKEVLEEYRIVRESDTE